MKHILLFILLLPVFVTAQVVQVLDYGIENDGILDNATVFTRTTEAFGREIWAFTGQENQVELLYDITPGPASSEFSVKSRRGDLLYVVANQHYIWRTDGTPGGTYNVVSNIEISKPVVGAQVNGWIYFTERDGNNNFIWRMNGNPNSEVIVTPNTQFYTTNGHVALDDTDILFVGRNNTGWKIWRSNGVVNQEVYQVSNSSAFTTYPPRIVASIDGKVYFTAHNAATGNEPWVTDGTSTGTYPLGDLYATNSQFDSSGAFNFYKVGETTVFTARDLTHGNELWKTDGTAAGTMLLKDITAGHEGTFIPSGGQHFYHHNGLLYFWEANTGDARLWKTDGTEAGTVPVTNATGLNYIGSTLIDGKIYLERMTAEYGAEPWVLDLETETLQLVADLLPGTASASASGFYKLNGKVYFNAYNEPNNILSLRHYRIDGILGAPDIARNSITWYPNPANDVIHIEADRQVAVVIYDLHGRILLEAKGRHDLDVSGLPLGVHVLQMVDEYGNMDRQKLVKR